MQFFLSNAIFELLRFEKTQSPNSLKMKNYCLLKRLILISSVCLPWHFQVSCPAAGKLNRYYDPNPIPADLKKDGYTLLVLKQNAGGFRGV